MNPQHRKTRWHTTRASLCALTLYCWTLASHAQTFAPDNRAIRFVSDIVLNDFHTAQAGGGYVFSYARQETDHTLVARLQRWFSGEAPQAIGMEPAEKQMLFSFYWAASMMSAQSPCFAAMADDGCQKELSKWLAREMNDDPRFVNAYQTARVPLGLPPLQGNGR